MRAILLGALLAVTSCAFPRQSTDDITSTISGLFAMDTNRAKDSQVTIDYQNMASHAHPDHDNAPKPLFTSVDASLLSGPTYSAFSALQALYTSPDVDTADPNSAARVAAASAFIDSIKSTNVFISAWNYLKNNKGASTDYDTFKQQLTQLWFTVYARNSVAGSSGFEAVFAGETQGNSVTRFNNWVAFYNKEKNGDFDYHGWFTRNKGVDLALQFMWGSAEAIEKSFLLETSPEAEFMAYTVCALAGNGQCSVSIAGVNLVLNAKTLTVNGVAVIDECYPSAGAAVATTSHPGGKTPAPIGDKDLQATVDAMRAADVDRALDSDYTLNWGNHVSGSKDVSPDPLFSKVNESVFNRTQYQKLIKIYTDQLFHPDTCTAEADMSGFRKVICTDWLNTMANTTVFQKAYEYLLSVGKTTSMDDLKTKLFMLWFGTYSRCAHNKSIKGSSGFEHVYCGEWKGSEVDGHHNWVNYYRQEKAGDINYHGYYSYDKQVTGTFQYTWSKDFKKTGGFLIGTSPAFDFSLLSICVLTHPNGSNCKFTIDGFPMGVTSYTEACDAGTCIATAYPTN